MTESSKDRFKPGISPIFREAFKLQRHAFNYLYPCPIQIGCRDEFAYFELTSWNKELIPWIFVVMVISGIVTLGSISLVLLSLLYFGKDALPSWIDFNPFQGMIVLVLGLGLSLQILTYFGVFLTPEMPTAFTGIQMIESECMRSLRATFPRSQPQVQSVTTTTGESTGGRRKTQLDIGMFAVLIVVLTSLFPLPTALITVLGDMDVYYFISEMFFLPVLYERDVSLTICAKLVRFAICSIILTELGRFISIFVVSLIAYILVTLSIVEKLPFCNKKCHFFYTQLRIHFVILRNYMDLMTGILIGGGYIIFLGSAWIVIKCYGDMPVLLYSVFLILILAGFMVSTILIPIGSKVKEQTELLVKQRQMYYFSVGTVEKSKFIQDKIWKAEKSVHYRCMWFFDINSDFFIVFWDHFLNDFVTVLLLF